MMRGDLRERALFSVGAPAQHESAAMHVTGRAQYVDDIPEIEGTLHAAIGYAPVAHARLLGIEAEAALAMPGVVAVLTARNIPGKNLHGIIVQDEPLLAESEIHYWGQPLFVVVADSTDLARRASRLVRMNFEPLPPVIDPASARQQDLEVVPTRIAIDGDPDTGMKIAERVCSGSVEVGGQEHFYLEGQVAYAVPAEDRRVVIYSATQHPSEMQQIIARTLGWPAARVNVQCRRMGGAFGGKESQSYIFSALAAMAATTLHRPVKLRVDRDDDFLITGKRHAFRIGWELAADATGKIQAARFDHLVQCGWSADYSGAVADRAVFHATSAYRVPNFRCESFRARTNTQSATAFRGFGGPQGILGMEVAIQTLALARGEDALDLRRRNLLTSGEGARLHYGYSLEDNVLPALITQLEVEARYWERRAAVDSFNRTHRFIKRGLALTPSIFGVGFGATFLNQAGALVQVYTDGTVNINHGGTEMGQGLNTKILQIVAQELGVQADCVFVTSTDTAKVPNTVSTAASSGADLNGMAALNAAKTLRTRLQSVVATLWACRPADVQFADGMARCVGKTMTFAEVCNAAFVQQVSLSAVGYYRVPKVAYDFETFKGRPFYYYVYGAACSEVEIDILTGELSVARVDILQDVGSSLNPALDLGQVEGGFVQGLGWLTSEELVWREDGFLATHAPQTYKIPTARDIPRDLRISFFKNENVEETVHRSKAVGEPPLQLAISAWIAIWDAVAAAGGHRRAPTLRAPATPEAILQAIESVRR